MIGSLSTFEVFLLLYFQRAFVEVLGKENVVFVILDLIVPVVVPVTVPIAVPVQVLHLIGCVGELNVDFVDEWLVNCPFCNLIYFINNAM